MLPDSVTQLLRQARAGDAAAGDLAYAQIHDQLRHVAHRQLRGRRAWSTMIWRIARVAHAEGPGEDVLALEAALQRLSRIDARLAKVVEWRYFGGLTDGEIGTLLGVTERTVHRDWRKARAFLYGQVADDAAPP